MARIQTHERMAALYRRAIAEGFRIQRDPDRRGIVFRMPGELKAGDALESGAPDPRFHTVADLMEHEGEMFDFLEASDRMAAAVLADGDGPAPPAPVRSREGLEPLPAAERCLPVVAGGQGRDARELEAETIAVLLVAGALFGLGLAAAAVAWLLS